MTEQPFFSIVMCVYNAEKYLDVAINSIRVQTYKKFELIIINDCSTDKSTQICCKHAEQDTRIRIFRTIRNEGVANARNEALKYVRGCYLTFVDADDYIDSGLLELVEQKLKQYKPQVLKYGCIEEYYTKEGTYLNGKMVHAREAYYSNASTVREIIIELEKLPLFGYLWNSFYDVSLLRQYNIRFDNKAQVNEDFLFNLEIFHYVEKFYCLDTCAYHYAKRPNSSLSTHANKNYYLLHVIKVEKLLEFYREFGELSELIEKKIFWLYVRIVYSSICRKLAYGDGNAKRFMEEVFASDLFCCLKKINACSYNGKEKLLVQILKTQNCTLIVASCRLMNCVKKHGYYMFAKIKE